MKKMVFTVTAENVPEDEMERAEMLGKIKPARDSFLAALKECGVDHKHETKVMTMKAASTTPRKKRGSAGAGAVAGNGGASLLP